MLHQMRKAEKVEFVKRLNPEKKFVPTYSMKYSQEIAKDMTVEEMQTHMRYHWSTMNPFHTSIFCLNYQNP